MKYDIDTIEDYLYDRLDQDTKRIFEQEMADDPVLREEVRQHKQLLKTFNDARSKILEERLQAAEAILEPDDSKPFPWRIFLWALSGLIILGAALWWWSGQTPYLAPQISPLEKPSLPPASTVSPSVPPVEPVTPPSNPQKNIQSPAAPQKPSSKPAQNAAPDPCMVIVRESLLFETSRQNMAGGGDVNYSDLLIEGRAFLDAAMASSQVDYQKLDAAVKKFKPVADAAEEPVFLYPAKYYMACCLTCTDPDKAKLLLEEIIDFGGRGLPGIWKTRARATLARLSTLK